MYPLRNSGGGEGAVYPPRSSPTMGFSVESFISWFFKGKSCRFPASWLRGVKDLYIVESGTFPYPAGDNQLFSHRGQGVTLPSLLNKWN